MRCVPGGQKERERERERERVRERRANIASHPLFSDTKSPKKNKTHHIKEIIKLLILVIGEIRHKSFQKNRGQQESNNII
jgi:hypothetical protein